MKYTLISFGTAYPLMYRRAINRTRKVCRSLGIPHHLQIIDPVTFLRFGWHSAVLYKPTFIKNMLHGFNDTVVWIDADCELLDKFDLPEGDWDIGTVPHQLLRNRLHFTPWVVSLLAIRPTEQAKRLVGFWEQLCQWNVLGKPEARCSDHARLMWALAVMPEVQVQNILPYVRGKVYLDARHKKRSKLGYDQIPIEYNDWYPVIKIPEDKDIQEYLLQEVKQWQKNAKI